MLSSYDTRLICFRQVSKARVQVCRTTIGMSILKSNKPTNTKNNMIKIMRFLGMTTLALVGTIMTGCSSNDNIIGDEQHVTPDNIVTVTATVGLNNSGTMTVPTAMALNDGGTTRALNIDYDKKEAKKTFAEGEQVALVYTNTSDEEKKSVATAENISADGKSASFTFTLVNPKNDQTVFYYYPAALVNESAKLEIPIENQNGTLANVESLDYAYNTGYLSGTTLSPSVSLENKFSIVAFTLKDATGDNDITSTITGMNISDGINNNITVNRTAAAGPIYVIMRAVYERDLSITATDGIRNYTKSLSDKTYAANNFYQQGLRMIPQSMTLNLSTLSKNFTAQNGDVLTGTLNVESHPVNVSIADGAMVTLNDVTINGMNSSSYRWAGINCLGNATIILSGTNTVKGFLENYPGIHVLSGNTLTIQGDGSLTVSSNGHGAGIGGGLNIACGNINIVGGTITATGGYASAGIGGGNGSVCGNITITNGVTKVTATKGENAANSIGAGGNDGTVGTVTIGGNVGVITDSPYTYQPQIQ